MSAEVLVTISSFVPTAILVTGVVEDVRAKKVRNSTILICAFVALVFSLLVGGGAGLAISLLAGLVALVISLPLVLFGVLGAGDMKLLVAFGFATNWQTVTGVFVSALIWGAVLGLLQSLLKGEILSLFLNIKAVLSRTKVEKKSLHTIPYTIALLFGWVSFLTIEKFGGKFL